jgi:hypothetical protein
MEQWNGVFPFRSLEVSPLPAAQGQSWPGLIYLSTLSFVPKAAQQSAGVAERLQFSFSDLMPFHELAHQWWGNVAGFSSYRDEWILEALANYCALLYLDSRKPADHVLQQTLEAYRGDLLAYLPPGNLPVDEIGPLALGRRLNSSLAPDGYARLIYAKGTWVVHMLRMMLRDPAAADPDARFRRLLHDLLEAHRFAPLSEVALRAQIAGAMTPDMDLEGDRSMDWFFDQWVHSTGIPRYAVEFGVTPEGPSFLVRGTLHQTGVPATFLARVPLYAVSASGKQILAGWVATSGEDTTFRFKLRTRPRHLVVDPTHTILSRPES